MRTDHDERWALLQGLMLGIFILHLVQPVAALFGDITWIPKHWVALSGGVIYGTSFFASLHKEKWSLWINIIGPCIGLTSIIGGWLLGFDIRPDTFQIMGGIPQVWALLTSVQLLRPPRVRYMD